MAHDPKLRLAVRAHFIQGLPLATAAKVVDISYQTARNWKRADKENGDDWDLAKTARMAGAVGQQDIIVQIVEELSIQTMKTLEELRNAKNLKPEDRATILTKLCDAFTKASTGAKNFAPKLSALSIAFDVLQELGMFINRNHPSYSLVFMEILEAFGPEISQRMGKP